MNCRNAREKLHDFLDQELDSTEMVAFRRHLEQCNECRRLIAGFGWIQEALRMESRLTAVAEEQLWQRIQAQLPRSVTAWLKEVWRGCFAFWRNLDRRLLWSKLVALPVACSLFVLLMLNFSALSIQEVSYPVLNLLQLPSDGFEQLVVTPVPVRQDRASQINELMSTAWKMSYEDSLSLVVKITREGHAEIDDVLEYPKNQELLEAVDLALRHTQFETAPKVPKPFAIYSFQKIDVYGDQRGM